MTFKELQKVVRFAKKSGILKLKMGSTEIEFTHDALLQIPKKLGEVKAVPADSTETYTDEQMLFWSTQDPLAEAN